MTKNTKEYTTGGYKIDYDRSNEGIMGSNKPSKGQHW